MSLAALPKVELHLHLEGAAPPAFIRGLAAEKSVDLSGIFDERGAYKYKDFWDFLRVYEAATSVLTTPEDYARLTRAVLEESAASGVVYSETFLSPDFCGGRDVGAWREYLAAIREAADAAETADGIILRGIVTCIRHFGPDKARETAICAAETAGDWIVGFGIAGDELAGKPQDFAWSFDCAREAGLRWAGERPRRVDPRGRADRAWRPRDRGPRPRRPAGRGRDRAGSLPGLERGPRRLQVLARSPDFPAL